MREIKSRADDLVLLNLISHIRHFVFCSCPSKYRVPIFIQRSKIMAWINDIYDTLYDENTICVACISYGKDSLAMLRAIKLLGLPLHRIVHTEVWATQNIPADLPPMVEFKKKADKIIKELYGIDVEHICATKNSSQISNVERERESYESMLYRKLDRGNHIGNIKGFPSLKGQWCRHLKYGGKVDIRRFILQSYKENENRKSEAERRESMGFPVQRGSLVQLDVKSKTARTEHLRISLLNGSRGGWDGAINSKYNPFQKAPRARGRK